VSALIFLCGDAVRYVGPKTFTNDDGSPLNIRGKIGMVEYRFFDQVNKTDKYVVDFGGNAFVCSPSSLQRQSNAGGTSDEYMRFVERKWKTNDDKASKKGKDK